MQKHKGTHFSIACPGCEIERDTDKDKTDAQKARETVNEILRQHPKPWHLTEYRNGVFFNDNEGQFVPQPIIMRYIRAVDEIIEHW